MKISSWKWISVCALFLPLSCTPPKPAETHQPATVHAASQDSLRKNIGAFLQDKKATVGIAVQHLGTGDTFSYNGHLRFPLMSVAKFPESLMLLSQIDRGERHLEDSIRYSGADLKVYTGSSFRKDHPGEAVSLTLLESMRYAMGQSDNISANKFFQLLGGPQSLEDYIHRMGIVDMGFSTDYAPMKPDSPLQNWGTPRALVQLLEKFDRKQILSDSMTKVLYKLMVESTSGTDRIKAGLPAGTTLAHKTGTSGKNAQGITAAFNDVGIVTLPDGEHYAIAVFIGNTKEKDTANAGIMQEISRMVWERYQK